MQAIKVYNLRQVDELIFLDINATRHGRAPDFELIDELADECFMPLTVGGGVRTVADIRRLLQVGADKVAINSAAVADPGLIRDAVAAFGSQCLVVSLDVTRLDDGRYEVVTHSGTQPTGRDPIAVAIALADAGAGEILLTAIDRDGTMAGYDLALIRQVADAVRIPVIAAGGAGDFTHMLAALTEGRASAVAAASMFHFTDRTPLEARQFLRDHGIPTRR
jgi:cyclase